MNSAEPCPFQGVTRRDLFSILLMCLDGYTVEDAVVEADKLLEELSKPIRHENKEPSAEEEKIEE